MFFLLLLFSLSLCVSAETITCSFLPQNKAPIIEYDLPVDTDLSIPIEFLGVTPIVSRKPLKNGKTPKLIIERYSSTPEIHYDKKNGSVIVTVASCSLEKSASNAWSRDLHSSYSMLLTIAGVMMAGITDNQNYPLALALAAAIGFSNVVHASNEELCMETVKVTVQSRSISTIDPIESCWEEINDPMICPEPFPTFETCDEARPICDVAVVGAGPGGLYAAMRLIDSGKVSAKEVCIFEMQDRVGGRSYSLRGLGPDNDLSVDAGAYRTWPKFTPTLHALITEYLELAVECYDDSNPCIVYNLVDESGNKNGFATFSEVMLQKMIDEGACWFPNHELSRFEKAQDKQIQRSFLNLSPTKLYFSNGVETSVSRATILNIPQRPLMKVIRNSDLDTAGILDGPKLDALHSVQTVVSTKLYLYYPKGHVFWYELGLLSGTFDYAGDAQNMLLEGRYHDGHVKCDDMNDFRTCHGFLLAVYSSDFSGNKAQYFRRFQRDRPEPVTFITNKDLEGKSFLKHAHKRLEEYHLYEKEDAPYTGFLAYQIFEKTSPPLFAVLATWNNAIPWAGGAYHGWTSLDDIDLAIEVFVENDIFVVNEAYSYLHGWAEGSIKVADQVLEKYLGVERPWNFTVNNIDQIIHDTSSDTTCDGKPEDESDNVEAVDDSEGGDAGDIFCFTDDALVEMANGTLKLIKDVKVGDIVSTGTSFGAGVVTEKLIHQINEKVSIAVVDTEHGSLMGTPSHPVLQDNNWVELRSIDNQLLKIFTRHIDFLYNLEIDGQVPGESSHSYVVNGIVASGLGDNEVLNRMYPRQQMWKSEVETSTK